MTSAVPLPLLLAPLLIAGGAIATLIAAQRAGGGVRWRDALGYQPDPARSVSFSAARYVGGHHALPGAFGKPFVLLTQRHLAVFRRRGGAIAALVPWEAVADVTLLDAGQMALAAIAVRGLVPGAVEAAAPGAMFLRVRYEDARGWWQNALLELAPENAQQQADEVRRVWQAFQPDPSAAPAA